MSIPSASVATIACALLLALSCAACTRPPPPPPEQPPEPQAHAAPREAIETPIDAATAVHGAVQGAAARRAAIGATLPG